RSADASLNHRQQEELFKLADKLFSVGPLLRDRLKDLVPNKDVSMLVPGLTVIDATHATSRVSAVAFGRLDLENDRIKQGRLVIDAFARAVAHAQKTPGINKSTFENPMLTVLGMDKSAEEHAGIMRSVEKIAGRAVTLRLLPYIEDPEELR